MAHIVATNSTGQDYKMCRAKYTLTGHVYILKSDNEEIVLLRTIRNQEIFGNDNRVLLREAVPFIVLVDPQTGKAGGTGEIVWLSHITPLVETNSVTIHIQR